MASQHFLFHDTEISAIYFQIEAETKAFLCPDNLQAWGWLKPRSKQLNSSDLRAAVDAFQVEKQDNFSIKSLDIWQ